MTSPMQPTDAAVRQVTLLAGRPPIREFVRFVKTKAVGGLALDDTALVEEWRQANVHVRALESGKVDEAAVPSLDPLPGDIAAEADEQLRDPAVQRSLGLLPYSWAMVELDRLIAWQTYVDLSFA